MNKNFIKNIQIKNFKCFDSFEAKGFSRVNLITGKNNIGKTAFMEAIDFYINSRSIIEATDSLKKLISRRQRGRDIELDIMHKNSLNTKLIVNNDVIELKYYIELGEQQGEYERRYEDADAPFLEIFVNKNSRIFPVNYILQGYSPMRRRVRGSNEVSNCNFISSGISSDDNISILYGKMIEFNKEDLLNDSLKLFDKNIIALKQIISKRGVILKLLLQGNYSVPLSSMGEGMSKYIEIITAIWASQEGYLFIDEMDNGIHYTKLDELWKVVLETSKTLNVQVFATTHSKECVESYARVAKKLTDKGVRLIELGRKDGKTQGAVLNYEELIGEIGNGMEVRGW